MKYNQPYLYNCRKYQAACANRIAARDAFTMEHQKQYGIRSHIHFPKTCRLLLRFLEWLRLEIDRAKQTDNPPSKDTFEASRVPELVAIAYRAMYAHGIYFRVLSAEDDKKKLMIVMPQHVFGNGTVDQT